MTLTDNAVIKIKDLIAEENNPNINFAPNIVFYSIS